MTYLLYLKLRCCALLFALGLMAKRWLWDERKQLRWTAKHGGTRS